MRLSAPIAILAALAAWPAAAQKPAIVNIGIVPSVPAAATWIAVEKGYFREAGIELQMEKIESVSPAMAMLASNRLQVIEGGLGAGYWNGLQQGLPVIMALERGSSPLYHELLVRHELKDKLKTIGDLKGHSVALVAPGSSAIYEMGKVLEANGLSLKDVEVKYIPFPQMGVALKNGAVDVALEVPPFGTVVAAQDLGVPWMDPERFIEPKPISFISYLANTDWIRQEVEDIMWKYRAVRDRELLHTMPWQARDPNGRFNVASILDLQDWFYKEKMITERFPAERLIDTSYAEDAARRLPPFEVINKSSTLGGCR